MAWETRGNREYLYRKKRVNGRVVSEYVGTGFQAELIARIEAIRREIGVIGYREDLRRLIVLRQAEVEAFNLAEQTMLDSIESWRNFISAKEQRAQLAKRCADFARANDMPIPHSGAFGHPLPSEVWFTSPGMMAQVQAMFDRARRDIPS